MFSNLRETFAACTAKVYNTTFVELLKKKVLNYFVKKYVGIFLKQSLSLDQFTVELTNGTGIIRDLNLDAGTLTELFSGVFIVAEGFIEEISISIPWHNLLQENCFMEINGLALTIHPNQLGDRVAESLVESIDQMTQSTMETSMEIAQECCDQQEIKDELVKDETSTSQDGAANEIVTAVAMYIQTVFTKAKIRLINTIIRIEDPCKKSKNGIALEVRIKQVDFFDEAGTAQEHVDASGRTIHAKVPYVTKKLHIEGIELYTDEFIKYPTSTDKNPLLSPHSLQSPTDEAFKTPEVSPVDEEEFNFSYKIKENLIEDSLDSNPILFAAFNGRQEVRMRLKQEDSIAGPKVDLELNIGSLFLFVTPRQIYLISELLQYLNSDLHEHHSALQSFNKFKQNPMGQSDFKRVESELQNNRDIIFPMGVRTHELALSNCWSSPNLDDSDEEFFPMQDPLLHGLDNSDLTSSGISITSDMTSSFNSNYTATTNHIYSGLSTSPSMRYTGAGIVGHNLTDFTSTTNVKKPKRKPKRQQLHENLSTALQLKLRIASFMAVVLHEDILTISDFNPIATPASISKLKSKANNFFTNTEGYCLKNLKETKKKFSESDVINLSHLCLLAGPISFTTTSESNSKLSEITAELLIGSAEIYECLVDDIQAKNVVFTELLHFENDRLTNYSYLKSKPNIKINLVQKQKMTSISKTKKMSSSTLCFQFHLDKCVCEIDISIVDRINYLLQEQKLLKKQEMPTFGTHLNKQKSYDTAQRPDLEIQLFLNASSMELKLMFPIPDLRPISDMSRMPWWKKNVRPDALCIVIDDLKFITVLNQGIDSYAFTVTSEDIHILYKDTIDTAQPISLIRAVGKGDKTLDIPKIVVNLTPARTWASTCIDDEPLHAVNIMEKSTYGFFDNLGDDKKEPFNTVNRATHEKSVTEEFIEPMTGADLEKFISKTSNSSEIHVEIVVPNLQIQISSRHLLEVIYNRLATDLLLWQPSAPRFNMNGTSGHMADNFEDFKSMYHCQSESDDDEAQYFSVYENKRQRHRVIPDDAKQSKLTSLTLQVSIGHGVASLITPFRNSENKVQPGYHGEFAICIENGSIFVASGYEGDENIVYNTISAHRINLHHKPSNTTSSRCEQLDPLKPICTSHLDAVLYPNDSGVITKLGISSTKSSDEFDNLTIVIKMMFDEVQNVKTNKIAGIINGTTLRHYMTSNHMTWVKQISDMFDINDYSVAGYILPEVITDLYFKLSDFAIDYRPLNLPLVTIVTIDSFSLSTCLSQSSDNSFMKFTLEYCGLFLSKNVKAPKVDIKKNYVCVCDIDMFEICVKIGKDKKLRDTLEVTLHNNEIHVRTCADSCRALFELLIYLSNDNDLIEEQKDDSMNDTPNEDEDHSKKKTFEVNEDPVFKVNEDLAMSHRSIVVQERLQDAMIEFSSPQPKTKSTENPDKGCKIFHFPGEESSNVKNKLKTGFSNLEVDAKTRGLSEAIDDDSDYFQDNNTSSDEDFVILDEDFGTGIKSSSGGGDRIRVLCDEPLYLDYEHFTVPHSRYNECNTSRTFSHPTATYYLKNLTLIWKMYRGSDFVAPKSTKNKVSMNDMGYEDVSAKINTQTSGVRFSKSSVKFVPSKSTTNDIKPSAFSTGVSYDKNISDNSWQAAGGPGRNKSCYVEAAVKKVRFLYEDFPEESLESTLKYLFIHDILVLSNVYSTRSRQLKLFKQGFGENDSAGKNSHILVVKSLTTRPDGQNGDEEISLSVSAQPLRIHCDQHNLMFGFEIYKDLFESEEEINVNEEIPSKPLFCSPVMTVNMNELSSSRCENHMLINVEEKTRSNVNNNNNNTKKKGPQAPYFKLFHFGPDVIITVKYEGRQILDKNFATITSFFMAFTELNNSQIVLKHIHHKAGLLGVDKLIAFVSNEWLQDIRQRQLPSIISGVGPLNPITQLASGIRDLFWLPFAYYQSNGQVMRGIQKGTSSFSSASLLAVVDLSGRMVWYMQSTAEILYDMVSYGANTRSKLKYRNNMRNPQDLREGMANALQLVQEGIGESANAVLSSIGREHEERGITAAIGEVARQLPPTALQPVVVLTEATNAILMGVKNSLDANNHREMDRWKL